MVSTDGCGSDGRTSTAGDAAGSGTTAPVAAQDKTCVLKWKLKRMSVKIQQAHNNFELATTILWSNVLSLENGNCKKIRTNWHRSEQCYFSYCFSVTVSVKVLILEIFQLLLSYSYYFPVPITVS
mgnify:FL=1